MIGTSWSHRLARLVVRPLVSTGVTPNHLTALRVITGVAACLEFALGTAAGTTWGGALWVLSAFLDRADGELARIGNMMSPGGHRLDYLADTAINTLLFVALGVGLGHTWLGGYALPLGLLSALSILLCSVFAERLEARSAIGTRAYAGRWGFDPDDALYLFGPLAWLGWLSPILVGAAVGSTVMMIITAVRLVRLRRAQAERRLDGTREPDNDNGISVRGGPAAVVDDEARHVDRLEIREREASQAGQVVVIPASIRRADKPTADPVVGQDDSIVAKRRDDDRGLRAGGRT